MSAGVAWWLRPGGGLEDRAGHAGAPLAGWRELEAAWLESTTVVSGPLGRHLLWTGLRAASGAPVLETGGRRWIARRVGWRLEHGTWPGMPVVSGCGLRWCLEPSHLALAGRVVRASRGG